jgi:hypothetical protein
MVFPNIAVFPTNNMGFVWGLPRQQKKPAATKAGEKP